MSELLRVETSEGVCVATVDAPPVNVMTPDLFDALASFADDVAADDDARVVVLRSANPMFFIAHFDVSALLDVPIDGPPVRPARPGRFHRMCERFRTMPKATICEIAGRVGGGGAELAANFDMRFGAIDTMVLNQMEVPLGILPGGSGTQRIPELVGRGRALEIILGGGDVDAVTAERWGWLNRAVPAADLSDLVASLARRIAAWPPEAVALAKQSVLDASTSTGDAGLIEEQYRFRRLLRTPAAQERMCAFLDAGGQTADAERRVADLTAELP